MKLIMDVPEDYYEIIKYEVEHHLTDYRPLKIIGNGIPLDDVKAEIEHLTYYWCEVNPRSVIDDVLQILDNIGKAESEESE